MLCSVFCSATYGPPCSLGRLSQGNAVGQEYLAIKIEIDGLGSLEELEHDLGILGSRLQDVLLGPVVQNELYRKRPVLPTTVLCLKNLHVCPLTHPDRLLRALFCP